jgi:hypothetical protein
VKLGKRVNITLVVEIHVVHRERVVGMHMSTLALLIGKGSVRGGCEGYDGLEID